MKEAAGHHMTDAELLLRYQQEKAPAWMGVLLQRYTLLLFGVCMKYLKNEEEARDAVQQIFLKVLTEVERHKVDFFKSWLYTVAKNHCLMRLREQHGKVWKELTENVAPQHEDLKKVELAETESTYLFLEESLHELTHEQQQCITLFYLQRQSYQQISRQTGYTLLQIKSYIQNGKRNLRLTIEKKKRQPGAKR